MRRSRDLHVATEVALCAFTAATAAGMWRLFDDASYLAPLLAHAVLAHGTAAILRRRRMPLGRSAAITAVAGFLVLCWFHVGGATTLGLPTPHTFDVIGDELRRAWATFGDTRAPAPVLPGFLLVAGAAVWVSAWLADSAAFRQWTTFEAMVPSATLFAFTSIFSADKARPAAAVLWLGASLVFVLLHRTARIETSPSWLGSDARHGARSLVAAGLGLVAASLVAAGLFGSRLPGADATPLVAVTPEARSSARQTISPLVELQSRLVEQSQVELFSVLTSRRAYWRLTALDLFDGERWASRGSFSRADGALEGTPVTGLAQPVTQTIDILALDAIWLPAAFEPRAIRAEEGEVRWDEESATLIVGPDVESSDGLTYEVVSNVFDHDAAALSAPGDAPVPDEIADRFLELPADFPSRVTELAEGIVAGAATPYERALALQDSFHDGSFTYSLAVQPSQSTSAIEAFLFENRTGFCQQFAGAYAAMARAVGLPTRVAVGFTPGQPDPLEPGRYVVRGENAHAWPEVYIADVGWVGFEPTPGRGAPGAEGYTGRPEQQDTAGPSTEPTVVGAGPIDPTDPGEPVDPTDPDDGGAPTTTLPGTVPPGVDGGFDPSAGAGATDTGPTAGERFVRVVGLLALAVVVVATVGGAIAGVRTLRRQRRRRRAIGPEATVAVIGLEITERVGLLGIVRRPWETDREFTRRLAGEIGEPEVRRLGAVLTAAGFDPAGIDEAAIADAEAIARLVEIQVLHRSTPWQRLVAAVDPRPPERQAQARARGRAPRPAGPRIRIRPATVER